MPELHDVDSKQFYGLCNGRYNVLFLHIPKAAGTSIRHVLGMPHGCHFRLSAYSDMIRVVEPTVFTVVRDPVSRFVSEWNYFWNVAHSSISKPPFLFFLKRYASIESLARNLDLGEALRYGCGHILPQSYYINPLMEFYDRVQFLRYENLASEWPHFCIMNDIPVAKKLPELNRRAPEVSVSDLSPAAIACIKQFYRIDYEQFFDSLPQSIGP